MIKTAQDAYLAGRQAALEKLAMSTDDKMGYGVNAAIGAAGFGTLGHLTDRLPADIDKIFNRATPKPQLGRFGRLGGLLNRNRYTLGLGALGAALGAAAYNKSKNKK